MSLFRGLCFLFAFCAISVLFERYSHLVIEDRGEIGGRVITNTVSRSDASTFVWKRRRLGAGVGIVKYMKSLITTPPEPLAPVAAVRRPSPWAIVAPIAPPVQEVL
jgi:hypothetical protein